MAMDEQALKQQIQSTINELIELRFYATAQRFNLSTAAFKLPKKEKRYASRNIHTDFYDLSISPTYGKVEFELTLKAGIQTTIQEKYKTRRTPKPEWAFLGFIKEGPFTLANLKQCKDLEALTTLATVTHKESGFFSSPALTAEISYTGLFLIAIDTDEVLEPEADSLTTICVPALPTIAHIAELKAHLRYLLELRNIGQSTSELATNTRSTVDNLWDEAERDIEHLQQSGMPEHIVASNIETILYRVQQESNKLYS